MRLKLSIGLALLTLSTLVGCYPNGPQYTTDLDLVYTDYTKTFDFTTKKTFAMADSVIQISGALLSDPKERPTMMPPTYADPLLNQIKTNMTKYGWTQVPLSQNPDVILLVSEMTTTNIYYYYDWSYWGWYYPGYPGWGWYYPGYYPPYISGYRSGSIFMQMIDKTELPNPPVAGGNVPVVWDAIINGLAQGSTAEIITRIQSTVDQAFTQSPYLKH